MRKAQGSLEYLIIIAAVLAIAAIVVLFMTGAFKSSRTSADVSACKQAASDCAQTIATSGLTNCSGTNICDACPNDTTGASGITTINKTAYQTPYAACINGSAEQIISA